MRVRAFLGAVLRSRVVLLTGMLCAVAVPAFTLPRLPHVNLWPLLLGLLPWVVGKYVLCPLRWRALTDADLSRRWHLRVYAEAEVLGLATPGHLGADVWRVRRLTHTGVGRPASLASVGLDRLVGAAGLAVFVAVAGTAMPTRMLLVAAAVGVVLVTAGLVLRRRRPDLLPDHPLPSRRRLAQAVALAAVFQLATIALLLGTLGATGYSVPPLQLLGAFGASQLAGALPGPAGASPKDGALIVGLTALGVPWVAAAAAVTLKATVVWLPALLIGGVSLLATRRTLRLADAPVAAA